MLIRTVCSSLSAFELALSGSTWENVFPSTVHVKYAESSIHFFKLSTSLVHEVVRWRLALFTGVGNNDEAFSNVRYYTRGNIEERGGNFKLKFPVIRY